MPSNAIANLLLRITSEEGDAERGLAKILAALKAFGSADAEAEAKIDTAGAQAELDRLRASLAKFSREVATGRADIDTSLARFHLEEFEVLLSRIDHEDVTVDFDVATAGALAKIAEFRAALAAVGSEGGPDRSNIASQALSIARAVDAIGSSFKSTDSDQTSFFRNLTEGLAKAKTSVGPLSISLANLGRALDVLLPIISTVLAVIVALGASLGAAIAGLAALGTAALAAGGPLLALGIGAITRFTGASKALEDYRSKMKAVRTATESLANAESTLRDAQISSRRAQDDLAQARADAAARIRTDITSALQAEQDAEYNLSQAQQGQLAAQEALTQARVDAARSLVDLKFAAEDAGTAEEEAKINLIKAQQELAAVEASGVGGLALREARLHVQEAENAVAESKVRSTRAQQDLNTAEKQGVQGNPQVVSTRQQLADANHSVAVAQQALVKAVQDVSTAQQQSVHTDRAVVSARQQVADANRQVADSQRRVAYYTKKLDKAQLQANRAQRKAQPVLTKTGQELKLRIRQIKNAFKAMTSVGSNRIWRGISDAIKQIIPTMESLKGEFGDLGGAIGDAFRKTAQTFSSPVWKKFFSFFTRSSTKLVPIINKSFLALARIFANIAKASMPLFLRGMRSIQGSIQTFAHSTSDIGHLRDVIKGLVSQTHSWLDFFGQLIRAIFEIGRAAAGPGQNFLDWITQGLRRFSDWASTDAGQAKITDFFNEMLPLGRALLDLLSELAKTGIQWSELMAPSITQLLKLMTPLVRLLNSVLEIINTLPGPVKVVIGAFLLWKGPIGIIRLLVGGLGKLFLLLRGGALIGAISGVGSALSGLAGAGGIGAVISKLGPLGLALRAIPWVAAGAAAIAYGDDLGRAAASLAGFSDDVIKATEGEADALGKTADVLHQIPAVQQALRRISGNLISTRDKFFNVFSSKQLDRMTKILAHGGDLAGKAWIQNILKGAQQEEPKLKDHISHVGDTVSSSLKGQEPKFQSAGAGIIKAIIQGIKAVSPALASAVKAAAKLVKNILPGSEPRDPRSPLRRLDLAGEAIIKNISRGMLKAQHQLPHQLAHELAVNVTGKLRPHDGRSSSTVNHNHFDLRASVAGGGFPDADVYMAAVSRNLRKRGLSLA